MIDDIQFALQSRSIVYVHHVCLNPRTNRGVQFWCYLLLLPDIRSYTHICQIMEKENDKVYKSRKMPRKHYIYKIYHNKFVYTLSSRG